MLTISKALNAEQARTYHAKEFTSAEQNYWRKGGAAVGEWQGALADKWGLSGAVDAEHFARLSEGQNPLTGEQLIQHRKGAEYAAADGSTVKPAEHRAGWDATFSAPKSVSLTALVGGDERVREAHREAVTTALVELERYTQARIGGNHAAESTGKFIAAKFEHDTARPVEGYAAPQLHTHAVLFNMTEREDGTPRALQPQSFFDSQQFATAVYQAELTYRLRDLGYEIEPGKSGAPEIAGYSQEYLDASSPRRQQIEEAVAKSGFNGPEAAEIAAHNTRDKKEILSPAEVLAAHRQIAAKFGNQAERVVTEARQRAQEQAQRQEQGEEESRMTDQRAQQAVSYAKERNFEREAVIDYRDLMRDALRRGMGELRFDQVRENFEQRQASGEFPAVEARKHATGQQFTTRETIAAEQANIAHMQRGQNSVQPVMSQEQAAEQARSRDFLNSSQMRAIEEVLTSTDRVHGFQGLAGSGKTTTLETIREGAQRQGYAVEGFAPTHRAARQLREAGISADTLQSFLVRGGQQQDAGNPDNRHLYMLDEASLASTVQMQAFLEKIGPQDRVLLVGDTRQHQGVDAGKPFEQMQDAGMRTAQLDRIMRQKDPELLRAVEHLSKAEIESGMSLLQHQGRITEIQDNTQRIETIARDYAARPEKTLIVSPDNASRREINQAVRAELQASGALSKDDQAMTILTPRNELSSAERRWAAKYEPGDVLYYSRGSKEHGIAARSYATVAAIDAGRNQITVTRNDGQQVSYDPERLRGITAYRETSSEFAQGDRIQFTANMREMQIRNRDLGTIEGIEPHRITVRMDGEKERTVAFDPERMKHFDHGYAMTSHSSQGLTSERVLVNMDTTAHPELLNPRFAYVSISRASHDAHIYTNDAATLGERLSVEQGKSSAADFRRQPPEEANDKQFEPKHKQHDPQGKEQEAMTINREEGRGGAVSPEQRTEETLRRHWEPIERELGMHGADRFIHIAERGDVQVYQYSDSGEHLAIDSRGQFYDPDAPGQQRGKIDQETTQIERETALEKAGYTLPNPIDHPDEYARRWEPIDQVLAPEEATQYQWRREHGEIQSYQHSRTAGHLHIDPQGQCYDRHANPISPQQALDNAHHTPSHSIGQEHGTATTAHEQSHDQGQGFGF